MADKKRDEFQRALSKIPPPISCFSNGVACPWCGHIHGAVSFTDWIECEECARQFLFGYPEWHFGKEPLSFVPFPWKEWEAFGQSADQMEDWQPNDRLKHIYFQKAEERLGTHADETRPN